MMNRRSFIQHVAALAAATSASPGIAEALEQYYEKNTPLIEQGLIAIDEVMLGGIGNRSFGVECNFYRNETRLFHWGMNALAHMCWKAMPEQRIMIARRDFKWAFSAHKFPAHDPGPPKDFKLDEWLAGHVSFINQNGVRETVCITGNKGGLA